MRPTFLVGYHGRLARTPAVGLVILRRWWRRQIGASIADRPDSCALWTSQVRETPYGEGGRHFPASAVWTVLRVHGELRNSNRRAVFSADFCEPPASKARCERTNIAAEPEVHRQFARTRVREPVERE